jgi:uncharacterized membrane protein YdjX (TVP38/TMEM64 family)
LTALLRLSPVLPYNVLNYALAITPLPLAVYASASAVATLPWAALYVYIGTFSTDVLDITRVRFTCGVALNEAVQSAVKVEGWLRRNLSNTSVSKRSISHPFLTDKPVDLPACLPACAIG